MPLKYSSTDELNNRLQGRLKIGGNATLLGDAVITTDLALQYGEQIEGWIDGILQKRYALPLTNTHAVLADIVENGVACKLLSQFYLGQSPVNNGPSDIGACVDYRRQLKMLEEIALDGEKLISRTAETVGFQWASIRSCDRNVPSEKVEW